MKVDGYLIFSILFITLLVVSIIIASVYASSFQKRPSESCPEILPCPDCPEEVPCPTNNTSDHCIYNSLNFAEVNNLRILSSVYYDVNNSNTRKGGFLSTTHSTVDGLEGLKLEPIVTENWTYDSVGKLFSSTLGNNHLFYVKTDTNSFFKSLRLTDDNPGSGWHVANSARLKNGIIILTTAEGEFNIVNYSIAGKESIAIASANLANFGGNVNTFSPTFPTSSPFFTSQVWRIFTS